MFIRLNQRRGQSTLEYGVIIGVVVAALIAVQAYVKRGLQGKMRQATNEIGEQYSPGNTTSSYTTETKVESNESTAADASDPLKPVTVSTSSQLQDRTGSEQVGAEANEDWGR